MIETHVGDDGKVMEYHILSGPETPEVRRFGPRAAVARYVYSCHRIRQSRRLEDHPVVRSRPKLVLQLPSLRGGEFITSIARPLRPPFRDVSPTELPSQRFIVAADSGLNPHVVHQANRHLTDRFGRELVLEELRHHFFAENDIDDSEKSYL